MIRFLIVAKPQSRTQGASSAPMASLHYFE
jgi:hypothetical protein